MHAIPLPTPTLRILNPQQHMRQDRAPEQTHAQVSDVGAVAGPIARLLRLEVDAAGDDAVEVAPAHDDADDDAALVDAFGVVADPRERVGDRGVDAAGAEEGAGYGVLVSFGVEMGGWREGVTCRIGLWGCRWR